MKHFIFVLMVVGTALCAFTTNKNSTEAHSNNHRIQAADTNILVLAMFPPKEKYLAASVEQHIAEDLIEKGFKAASAFDKNLFQNSDTLSETTAMTDLKAKGFSNVLILSITDVKKEKKFDAASARFYADNIYTSTLTGYFNNWNGRIGVPDFYNTFTTYNMECHLYSGTSGKLEASVPSMVYRQAGSIHTLAHMYAKQLVKTIIKKHYLR